MSERTEKLVSIRHRTDQDLCVLVSRELARGFTLVNMATTRNSPFFPPAEKAHATAAVLLSKVSAVSDAERLRMESSLLELRCRLDRVAKAEAFPASFAS